MGANGDDDGVRFLLIQDFPGNTVVQADSILDFRPHLFLPSRIRKILKIRTPPPYPHPGP